MYNYFFDIHYNILLLFVLIEGLGRMSLRSNFYRSGVKSNYSVFVITFIIILSLWMGFRPGTDSFGDTKLYQSFYENGVLPYVEEPVFNIISAICMGMNFSSGLYLSLIAFLYIFFPYYLLSGKTSSKWYVLLFVVGSFSFLGYGVNGIRNGLALSLVTYAMTFIDNNGKDKLVPLCIFCLLSIGIHKSALLPIICLFISMYLIKDIKTSITIWVLSIFVSLVAGSAVSSLFIGLGFDDRLDSYLQGDGFTKGFRWDFILYSVIPIFLAYYIKLKRIATDRIYNILINTYILANAIWIMVINANFSNRFAYLSWFLYPVVIAYPILRFDIWRKQTAKAGIVLIAYFGFTYLMFAFKG